MLIAYIDMKSLIYKSLYFRIVKIYLFWRFVPFIVLLVLDTSSEYFKLLQDKLSNQYIVSIIPKLFTMYKLNFLSVSNLKYSDDVSRTRRTIKDKKRHINISLLPENHS